uniref:Uncharacterized protein n=1 Tax=Anguilla anguilla TaxID=7936 RepID=A0A0E9RI53_ANGAN
MHSVLWTSKLDPFLFCQTFPFDTHTVVCS